MDNQKFLTTRLLHALRDILARLDYYLRRVPFEGAFCPEDATGVAIGTLIQLNYLADATVLKRRIKEVQSKSLEVSFTELAQSEKFDTAKWIEQFGPFPLPDSDPDIERENREERLEYIRIITEALRKYISVLIGQLDTQTLPRQADVSPELQGNAELAREHLSGQSLNLFDLLFEDRQFVDYSTLEETDKLWRVPDPAPATITRAIERLAEKLSKMNPILFEIENRITENRVRLKPLTE